MDPSKVVEIKNEAVHPTDLVPHIVLTKQDAEQAASKLVENLKPHAFHGGMNVSIHRLVADRAGHCKHGAAPH